MFSTEIWTPYTVIQILKCFQNEWLLLYCYIFLQIVLAIFGKYETLNLKISETISTFHDFISWFFIFVPIWTRIIHIFPRTFFRTLSSTCNICINVGGLQNRMNINILSFWIIIRILEFFPTIRCWCFAKVFENFFHLCFTSTNNPFSIVKMGV